MPCVHVWCICVYIWRGCQFSGFSGFAGFFLVLWPKVHGQCVEMEMVHASFLHHSRALLAHVQHSRDVLQQRAVDADVLVAGPPAVGLVLGHGVEPAQARREGKSRIASAPARKSRIAKSQRSAASPTLG